MTVRKIKQDLRDRILDALEAGEPMTKAEMRSYVKRRCNSLSFENLREFAVKRILGECVTHIKQSHSKGWKVNERDVVDMPHNVDDSMIPERVVLYDQAKTIIRRNEQNLHGRMAAHVAMVKRFERQHPLSADAIRRRRQLEKFIFSH